jgi:hypothetical protein
MSESLQPSGFPPHILQLLDWLEERPRTYVETMEAWRTACPRLSAWEDAVIERLVSLKPDQADRSVMRVGVTARGRAARASVRSQR